MCQLILKVAAAHLCLSQCVFNVFVIVYTSVSCIYSSFIRLTFYPLACRWPLEHQPVPCSNHLSQTHKHTQRDKEHLFLCVEPNSSIQKWGNLIRLCPLCDSSVCFPGGLKVTCEYMAQQEGVLCEEVLLLSETNEDVCVKVKVQARVMGEATFSNERRWSNFYSKILHHGRAYRLI